jgi:fatty-acyl-CoA synthase
MPDEVRRLDAREVLRALARHRADHLMIIGDAFARPLLQALREGHYDLSSLRMLTSTAAVLSTAVKDELLSALPDGVMLLESIGGSELGLQAMSYDTNSGEPGLPAYQLRDNTVLVRDDRQAILGADNVGEIGWTASTGHLPLGYLGDEAKTREVFPVIAGTRYSVGGDRARYLPDGRVVFLGRESSCINTGGEKVFAEEVERIVKSHPAVYDALVVGLPSPRWGEEVTAVVSLQPGNAALALDDLRAHCDPHLADYKVPKALVLAPEIVRSPSGQPDSAWAKSHAAAAREGHDA